MSDKQSTKPARGTRDFLPGDVRRREYVIGVVREVYERYGFEPLETPAVENIETLLGKYGEEGNQLIFKILKRGEHEKTGEADLALRYDLTVPLARVVAEYQGVLPTLFKRYQIQPVWRADRPARGRFREFYQCDIDATGSTSPVVEAEILGAVSEILSALGFSDFVIRINHRQLLSALLKRAGVQAEQQASALVAIDKVDKIGFEGVDRDLASRGFDDACRRILIAHLNAQVKGPGLSPEWLEWLDLEYRGADSEGQAGIDNLRQILELAESGPAASKLSLHPGLARGLSYYTGAIMEIAVEGIGSLGGGGRYDNLVGMFLGRDVPACGFSLGLERIIVVMTEREMFPAAVVTSAVDIVVTFLDHGSRVEALTLAGQLRAIGRRVDVFPEAARKFDKPLKYASARGARVMAIFGENEVARGEASVRNLATREQSSVPRAEAVAAISRILGA
ncbi:MAG: histidine--tRNA ligase [Vicinamibacterales bacterium]